MSLLFVATFRYYTPRGTGKGKATRLFFLQLSLLVKGKQKCH